MIRFFYTICLLSLFLLGCDPEGDDMPDPTEKGGTLQFDSGPDFQGKIIPVHYFIPIGDVSQMPFQIVFHGADRNGKDYLAGWAQKAREYGVIIIAPEFSTSEFNTTQYNEGNFVVSGNINAPEKTTFALIDQIFEFVKAEFSLNNDRYNIYGHSAGAQFVHRYLQFYDTPKLDKAISANAGWYTFPDESFNFPYGINGLFQDPQLIREKYYQKNLIVFLGTADTLIDNNLRVTSQANRQGRHRRERGETFYNDNLSQANAAGQNFNWKLEYAEGVGHDHRAMSSIAADILYKE